MARLANTVKAYVGEAIHIKKAGKEVGPAPEPAPVLELQIRLDKDPALRVAFEALTPGRRRECNLCFSGAKQAKTPRGTGREVRPEDFGRQGLPRQVTSGPPDVGRVSIAEPGNEAPCPTKTGPCAPSETHGNNLTKEKPP